MNIAVITIFPEMFDSLRYGVVGQALKENRFILNLINPRDFTEDVHRTVDDRPFGGGPGMVMLLEPLVKAMNSIDPSHTYRRILMSCSGSVYNQKKAKELSSVENLMLICGRYEGVDYRIKYFIDEELSVGDYVLSGGELAAMCVIDSIVRLLPDVVGNPSSTVEESFSEGLLEYPQYTRPREFMGYKVPDILFSGNHNNIKRWRRFMSLMRTKRLRPDLFERFSLTDEDKKIISQLEASYEDS
jgi:tRNA (guanine37-N1)-methyltransferase